MESTHVEQDGTTRAREKRPFHWLAAGFTVWLCATWLLALIGDPLLGAGLPTFWLTSVVVSGLFVSVYLALTRVLGTHPTNRLSASVAFAVPGMLGEVAVFLTFPLMVPDLAESASRLAAFLFLGYALLLATGYLWSKAAWNTQ